jgi:uncharacterized protein
VRRAPACRSITNFPQGWPKLAQSAILSQPTASPPAIIVASLLPLRATLPHASLTVNSSYPFGDTASISVAAANRTTLKIRIPGWAFGATVNGRQVANGTLAEVLCPPGTTAVVVDLRPTIRFERGWGDVLSTPRTDAVAVVRGPLVFALHPSELKTVVRSYNTTPATAGEHAPDYLIRTDDPWNFAIDLDKGASFDPSPSRGWSLDFPFDDSGTYPFSVRVTGRQVSSWGYWRGSNITNPPPVSPVDPSKCGAPTPLTLVPFGSTNIRISVFPHVASVTV